MLNLTSEKESPWCPGYGEPVAYVCLWAHRSWRKGATAAPFPTGSWKAQGVSNPVLEPEDEKRFSRSSEHLQGVYPSTGLVLPQHLSCRRINQRSCRTKYHILQEKRDISTYLNFKIIAPLQTTNNIGNSHPDFKIFILFWLNLEPCLLISLFNIPGCLN